MFRVASVGIRSFRGRYTATAEAATEKKTRKICGISARNASCNARVEVNECKQYAGGEEAGKPKKMMNFGLLFQHLTVFRGILLEASNPKLF